MALQQGTRLGAYEILSPLGAGGMGEVYRARDTKLQRDVALKILPESMARDAQRMARFEREAQVLASLNHPNIAAIYGLEESNGIRALVMELVEGETLAERLRRALPLTRPASRDTLSPQAGRGQKTADLKSSSSGSGQSGGAGPGEGSRGSLLDVDDALPIAKQIAEALEYAHERGVIHRDLKPANVKITPEGAVKVLDFGLAKVLESQDSTATMDIANSPTLSAMATQAGMILGTAAYMSPEQAKGQRVDRRADIWAFGCVLYEMLSGQKPFEGETISDVLAAVIRAEPEWTAIPEATPQSIKKLVHRCLVKDARQRLRDIGDARITIEETLSGEAGSGFVPALAETTQGQPQASRLRRVLPWVLAGISVGVAAIFAVGYISRAPKPQPVIRLAVPPPENTAFTTLGSFVSLSPNGQEVAFITRSGANGQFGLWVRALDSLTARRIQGISRAFLPFWSPDGRYIGFFAGGELKKVALSGGPPQTLCAASVGRGGTWNRDGTILFASKGSLYRVPDAGGTPTLVLSPDKARQGTGYTLPQFLPDGRHFIFAIAGKTGEATIAAGSLGSREITRLVQAGSQARYAPPSQLLYLSGSTLMARPFDAKALRFTGQAVPVAENVGQFGTLGYFSVSPSGVLAYQAVPSAARVQMALFNHNGKELGTLGPPGIYGDPAISPDGKKLAVEVGKEGKRDIWVYDLKRGTGSRLTFSPADDVNPVWSADGKRILFTSNRQGQNDIYEKSADGLGSTQPVLVSKQRFKNIEDLSRDGRYAIYGTGPSAEVWILPLFGGKKRSAFIQGKFKVPQAEISPNGQYVAYTSNETGRNEVYVQTFPQHKGKWEISTAGGSEPMWQGDGKELFYLGPDEGMMAVQVNTAAGRFQVGTPKLLFKTQLIRPGYSRNIYVVSPDGKRFLMLVPAGKPGSARITVVVNWLALLKKQ